LNKCQELTSLEVHIGIPIPKCQSINTDLQSSSSASSTSESGGYATEILDNLIYRYEEPNGMTRWDSPLFTVPFHDEAPPCAEIWEAMIGSEGTIKTVKPNSATVMVCQFFSVAGRETRG